MGMYGEDYEYANSRLAETIVRLNGEPVYIIHVGKGMVVKCTRLDNDEVIVCNANALDLHPVPLGYCNYNKYACYLSRIPMRRDWRQGLRKGNYISLSGADASRIPYDAVRKVIIGEFPTYEACLEACKKLKSIAWHRHWAMDANGQLFYKGGERPVGVIKDGLPELSSRHMYLTEALKESL